jgi:hypothetical protein
MPALFSLLEALARKKPAGVRFVLAGPHDAELERVARGLPVEFAGILPHAEARALQRSADRLLFVRNEGPGYAAMVPGKTYEYLDARRPVVAMVAPGEAADLLAEGGARVFGSTQGDEALAALLEGPTPNAEAIDRILAGRSRRALAGRHAGVLDELA